MTQQMNNKKITLSVTKAIVPILLLLFMTTMLSFAQNDSQLVIDSDNQRKFDSYFYDALSAKAQGKYAEAFFSIVMRLILLMQMY